MMGCVFTLAAADNVILFIGDGMGQDHVKAGRVLVNGSSATPLNFENLGYTAESITVLPDGAVTDSATAGTALATGYQHPANGVISMGANFSIKNTILELAKAKGFRTGIITTDDIGGATPGAFGAHEPDRTYMADIRYDYLMDDTTYPHPASLPNILLGGGYDDPTMIPGVGLTYAGAARNRGYSYIRSSAELETAGSLPLLGLFGTAWAPMTAMVLRPSTEPRLSAMVAKALSMLENSQGLFLMAESANIDKLSHSNDKNFVWEVSELEAAVQTAVAWKNSHPGDNTLILLTADHETGGLTVPDQTVTPGTVPAMSWSSTGHTSRNVPVFATWPASLQGLIIDNTEVFFLLDDYLNISTGGKPPEITGVTTSGITESGAIVQWDTLEPSTSALYDGSNLIAQNTARATRHALACTGLSPGTQYQLTASSTDISGCTGMAGVSFSTKASDLNARVIAEPAATFGTISGTIAGVATSGDGLAQLVTEATSGAGSRMVVEYTLHTAASPALIESLTLRGAVGWTALDGTADQLVTEVRVALPEGYGWERITFPFQATPACGYVNANGDVVLRFSDSASIKRERKDTLSVDHLLGEVILGSATPEPPTQPGTPTASTVAATAITLTWADSANETSYMIWRYTAAGGWVVAAEPVANDVTYTDMGLTPGTTYTYVVRAVNGDGYADSAPLSVQTPSGLLAPTNVKATAAKGAIALTWTDPNTTEDGYQVLRGLAYENVVVFANLAANVISFTDQSVSRGKTYYYQVRALKTGGEAGPVSATVSATAR